MAKKNKKKTAKPADPKKECQVTGEPSQPSLNIIMDTKINPELLSKWPRLRNKVPGVFLHDHSNLLEHIKAAHSLCIDLQVGTLGNCVNFGCKTFNDHKLLTQYFEKEHLSYHTFGYPSKRKLKVVIKGLSMGINLNKLKQDLKLVSVPVIRIHKMHTKEYGKNPPMYVLAVVPYDNEGKNILKLLKVGDHEVILEPPKVKAKQCFRCQRWGHSQRYCHGQLKCVKCAGNHSYKKCKKDRETEPPKCANCGGEHTASYRNCDFCPDSDAYKKSQLFKQTRKRHRLLDFPMENEPHDSSLEDGSSDYSLEEELVF